MPAPGQVTWRREVGPADPPAVARLVAATGFFSGEEVGIARELVEERLRLGPASGYEFLLAEDGQGLAGYACFGRIPGTQASYDLYWIAVRPGLKGQGLGRQALARAESLMAGQGGTRVYVDTSSRAQYEPTRAFYERCGYGLAASFPDFYAPGEAKVVYCKVLA